MAAFINGLSLKNSINLNGISKLFVIKVLKIKNSSIKFFGKKLVKKYAIIIVKLIKRFNMFN